MERFCILIGKIFLLPVLCAIILMHIILSFLAFLGKAKNITGKFVENYQNI